MALSKKGRYVYCYECGSRGEINGKCKICGHTDNPLLPGMVPNLLGMTQAAAELALTGPECQLKLGAVSTETSETVPVNLIISTDPVEGTQKNKGTVVKICISLGPAD